MAEKGVESSEMVEELGVLVIKIMQCFVGFISYLVWPHDWFEIYPKQLTRKDALLSIK